MDSDSDSRDSRSRDMAPRSRLSEGGLHRILGYQLAQARVVTDDIFEHHAGASCDLRSVEFTILMLVQADPDVSAAQRSAQSVEEGEGQALKALSTGERMILVEVLAKVAHGRRGAG